MNCANCRNNIPDPPPRSAGIWVEVMRDEYGFGYRPPHFPVSRRRISGRKANSVPPDAHLSFSIVASRTTILLREHICR